MNISPRSKGFHAESPTPMPRTADPAAEYHRFIADESFPCLAARGIAKRMDFTLKEYDRMNCPETARALAADLLQYTDGWTESSGEYRTFVACFSREPESGEIGFENGLWTLLARLTELDPRGWDPSVSVDPDDPAFSFSFAGEAYYIVGLHPRAARPARRFGYPALVFNRHRFFEELRETGGYERMRDLVRERDLRENGSINPMLADFGTISEARQYAGRQVDDEWKCPHADAFLRRQRSRQ